MPGHGVHRNSEDHPRLSRNPAPEKRKVRMPGPAAPRMFFATLVVIVAGLATASSASADCEKFAPGDPQLHGIRCSYNGDPESNDDATPIWRVPAAVDEATFQV
jgi:hypothetical protein